MKTTNNTHFSVKSRIKSYFAKKTSILSRFFLHFNYSPTYGNKAICLALLIALASFLWYLALVSVDGRIQTRSYDNNQGQRVYVTEVVADSVQFLETRAQRERTQQSAPMMQQPTMTQQPRQNNNDFYDMKTVDLDKDFDDSVNSYDIMEDDIQSCF